MVLTKEEIDGEIINETEHFYLVQDGDREHYVCKHCGTSLTRNQLAAHLNKCENAPAEVKGKTKGGRPRKGSKKDAGMDDRDGVRISEALDIDDDIIAEMVDELYNQLTITPGAKGHNDKIEWVCRWFSKNRVAQENPQKLYEVLSRTFKSMDDEAVNFIVDAVFSVKQSYNKDRRGYQGRFSTPFTTQPFQPFNPMQMQPADAENPTMWMLYQMWNDMKELMKRNQGSDTDVKQIKEMIEAEIERKYLRDEVERLREQMSTLIENYTKRPPSTINSEGWNDDYARLVAEMGGKVLDLGERIVLENKKTRKLLIKYIAPRLMSRGGEEGEGHEVLSEGETDEEIVEELEKEGYAE
ncbi:MAG: hypothetical protein ACXQT3_01895 [Methermicoccaceae archaeon]